MQLTHRGTHLVQHIQRELSVELNFAGTVEAAARGGVDPARVALAVLWLGSGVVSLLPFARCC